VRSGKGSKRRTISTSSNGSRNNDYRCGAVVGHRLDKSFKGVGEDIFEIAKEFFKLVTDVFNEIFRHVVTA
jgi:hypothetical protein